MINTAVQFGENFFRRIKSSVLFKNTAYIVMGNLIAQVLSIIFTPINSRLFGPIYYGEFGVFSATINMVNGMVCLGLVSAIVSPKEDQEASLIYKTCLVSCSTFAFVMLTLVMLLAPHFKVIQVSGNYYGVVALMSLFMIVNNWGSMTYAWGNRKKCYKLLMFNPIIAVLVNFLISFGLGLIGAKAYGLIIGAIASQVAILIHLLIHLRPMSFKYQLKDAIYVLKAYQDFPKYQMTTNLLKGIGTQFPILMMATHFGSSFIGQYNMGQRLLYLPITMVGGALGQVHFKQATDMVNNGKDAGELTYNTIKIILFITFVPFLACAVFGQAIFETFLGVQWGLAGDIARLRSYEFMLTSMFFSVSYIFVVLKAQRLLFNCTILALVLNNLIVWIFGSILSNNLITVIAMSLASALLNYTLLFYAFSKTKFGVTRFNRLMLSASALFILVALLGNYGNRIWTVG